MTDLLATYGLPVLFLAIGRCPPEEPNPVDFPRWLCVSDEWGGDETNSTDNEYPAVHYWMT